jgi:hypothetical protein
MLNALTTTGTPATDRTGVQLPFRDSRNQKFSRLSDDARIFKAAECLSQGNSNVFLDA